MQIRKNQCRRDNVDRCKNITAPIRRIELGNKDREGPGLDRGREEVLGGTRGREAKTGCKVRDDEGVFDLSWGPSIWTEGMGIYSKFVKAVTVPTGGGTQKRGHVRQTWAPKPPPRVTIFGKQSTAPTIFSPVAPDFSSFLFRWWCD